MRVRMISSVLVLALLMAVVAPALMPRRSEAFIGALITVGAVLAGGHMAKGLIDDTIDKAEGAAKEIMREAATQITKLLQQIEATYGNALNTTLDSLDAFTGQQLAKIATLFDQINQKLMEDVAVIHQAVIDLLQQVNQMVQQTISRLEDLIVVGVRGATFVIDKTTYNVSFLIAIVLLAIGLIVFTRLLWTGKVPRGWVRVVALGFMAFYVLLFSALLVPQTRVYAITMVGQADKLKEIGPGARIFSVTPAKVMRGSTVDLNLIGANYDAGGEPKVVIADQEVAPRAWSDSHINVRLTGALANLSGPQSVFVKTSDGKSSSPAIVEFVSPPPPAQILSWRLVPSGRAYDFKQFGPVQASCEARSFGATPFTKEVRVDSGWELAADEAHRGSVDAGTPGSTPNPPLGFSENNVSKSGNGQVQRVIEYLPTNDAAVKNGIKVAGACISLPFGGNETRWSASYIVWGRKLGPKDGVAVTGSNCSAQGLRKCGTYPADKLAMFKDGRPDNYSLMVTIRTPSGQTLDRSTVFTPGTPGQKLTVENVAIWMENNELWVKGPGGNKLPDIIIHPIKPLPIKDLPIFR